MANKKLATIFIVVLITVIISMTLISYARPVNEGYTVYSVGGSAADDTANLNVKVTDANNKGVDDVTVELHYLDGRVIIADKLTTGGGEVQFKNVPTGDCTIIAYVGNLRGEATTILHTGNNDVVLQLLPVPSPSPEASPSPSPEASPSPSPVASPSPSPEASPSPSPEASPSPSPEASPSPSPEASPSPSPSPEASPSPSPEASPSPSPVASPSPSPEASPSPSPEASPSPSPEASPSPSPTATPSPSPSPEASPSPNPCPTPVPDDQSPSGMSIALPPQSNMSYIYENNILSWIVTGPISNPTITAYNLFVWGAGIFS